MKIDIIAITNRHGQIDAPEWLGRCEAVHRQLRPKLVDYTAAIRRVCAGGARLIAATIGQDVVGVALYRIYETTFDGRRLHVDDLVTDEAHRSKGVGNALFERLQEIGRDADCDMLSLESGTHRQQAHKFYFREGMVVQSFAFRKPLKEEGRI